MVSPGSMIVKPNAVKIRRIEGKIAWRGGGHNDTRCIGGSGGGGRPDDALQYHHGRLCWKHGRRLYAAGTLGDEIGRISGPIGAQLRRIGLGVADRQVLAPTRGLVDCRRRHGELGI
jgi:hypothetical protein